MALSFLSNLWNPSASPQQKQNPDIVGFQQRKKPRFSNLSFSNTYSNPCPLIIQNDDNNSFFPHHNNVYTSTSTNYSHFLPTSSNNNNAFFNSLSSPQTLFPLEELEYNPYPYSSRVSDQFFDGFSSSPDLFPELLTDEDRILLAPLLREPQVICDFPVQQDNDVVYDCGNSYDDAHHQEINTTELKKGSSGGSSSTAVSPQSVAARERRRKITEKTQELGKLVPGGNKMSTAEMFQAAYKYVKFLQAQVSVLQSIDSLIQVISSFVLFYLLFLLFSFFLGFRLLNGSMMYTIKNCLCVHDTIIFVSIPIKRTKIGLIRKLAGGK